MQPRGRFAAILMFWLVAGWAAMAQAIEPALLDALRGGGHVLYFRHAATEWAQEDRRRASGWDSCAGRDMRQLSAAGRESAREVGEAMRRLGIPVAKVLASEFCRTTETAGLLALAPVEPSRSLINSSHAELAGGRAALRDGVRALLATVPPPGANTVLVSHGNVLMLAAEQRPVEGGAAVVRPDGAGGFEVIAQIAPDEWIAAAARR